MVAFGMTDLTDKLRARPFRTKLNHPMRSKQLEDIFQNIEDAREARIIRLSADKQLIAKGNCVVVDGQPLVNFGSCSYVGLELDPRIKRGMINMVQKYGSQFSSSRVYLGIAEYAEYEELINQIFGMPTALASTTTLGHLANLPVLLRENDAVIVDQLAHASIQGAVQYAAATGFHAERIKHNNHIRLEECIWELSKTHDKVWYLADGIYSMHGDIAPLGEIYRLLNAYEKFHFYVDDAHGMGWAGQHGKGYVLDKYPFHERLYFTTSLAKGFAAAGGALVFPNAEMRRKVENCGGTMTFAGPIQPAVLGAGIASAKIHLSAEITERQHDVLGKIQYFLKRAKQFKLPLVGQDETPIFFIGIGSREVGYRMVHELKRAGYWTNLGVFPAVPQGKCGLRLPITQHHSREQIDGLLTTVAELLKCEERKGTFAMEKAYKTFRLNQA